MKQITPLLLTLIFACSTALSNTPTEPSKFPPQNMEEGKQTVKEYDDLSAILDGPLGAPYELWGGISGAAIIVMCHTFIKPLTFEKLLDNSSERSTLPAAILLWIAYKSIHKHCNITLVARQAVIFFRYKNKVISHEEACAQLKKLRNNATLFAALYSMTFSSAIISTGLFFQHLYNRFFPLPHRTQVR